MNYKLPKGLQNLLESAKKLSNRAKIALGMITTFVVVLSGFIATSMFFGLNNSGQNSLIENISNPQLPLENLIEEQELESEKEVEIEPEKIAQAAPVYTATCPNGGTANASQCPNNANCSLTSYAATCTPSCTSPAVLTSGQCVDTIQFTDSRITCPGGLIKTSQYGASITCAGSPSSTPTCSQGTLLTIPREFGFNSYSCTGGIGPGGGNSLTLNCSGSTFRIFINTDSYACGNTSYNCPNLYNQGSNRTCTRSTSPNFAVSCPNGGSASASQCPSATCSLTSYPATCTVTSCTGGQSLVGGACQCPNNSNTIGNSCQCNQNFYGNASSGGSCNACPTGSTTSSTGATSISQCLCANNVALVGGACPVCPINSTGNPPNCNCTLSGQTFLNGSCQCTGGQSLVNNVCACPIPGQSSVNGACRCPIGQSVVSGSCASCPGGGSGTPPTCTCPVAGQTYNAGTNSCGNCPANSTSNGQSCLCNANFYGNASVSGGSCTACTGGTTTNGATGSTSSSSCVCPTGQGLVGNTCAQCPGGSQNGTPPSCNCPGGQTYNSSTNTCGSCPQNSSLIGTSCQCNVNYFGSASTGSSCNLCPGGSTTNGATGSTQQSQCTCTISGQTIQGNNCACVSPQVLNPAGNACINPQCTNGASNPNDNPPCTNCPINTYRNGTACTPCPGGSNSLAGSDNIADCTCTITGQTIQGNGCACVSPQVLNPAGNACINPACPNGASNPNDNPPCTNCPANKYLVGTNCVDCPNGTASLAGSDSLSDCTCTTTGQILISGVCQCPVNTYLNSNACTPCPNGSNSLAGSDNIADCTCNVGVALVNGSCPNCPLNSTGTFPTCNCDANFFKLNGSCTPCPAGSTTIGNGATSVTQCNCSNGRVLITTNGVSSCQCPATGQTFVNNACQCPPGQTDVGTACINAQPNAVLYIPLASVSFTPAKNNQSKFGEAPLVFRVVDNFGTRISAGSTCVIDFRPYGGSGNYITAGLTDLDLSYDNVNGCSATLPPNLQTRARYEFRIRITDTNGLVTGQNQVYGIDTAYTLNFGAIGVVGITAR